MAPMMARPAKGPVPPQQASGQSGDHAPGGVDPKQVRRLTQWAPGVASEGAFSAEECDRILTLGGHLKESRIFEKNDGSGGEVPADDYRNSHVTFIKPSPESKWLFDKLGGIVAQANQVHYQMELFGFSEPLQIAAYGPGQKYDWHLDIGNGKVSIRKLSIVIQLSDPADYEGGSLTTMASKDPFEFPKTRGTVIIFPSYVLHRVPEVTKGLRYSLAAWIGGPPYR
ncbi:MAG: 2OG-Fe(II) oxygenase [Alphaproteobacteria bacterium]|nr:2OG-Fe(II) oxygenase [Alphaproteobacteria bacterium]